MLRRSHRRKHLLCYRYDLYRSHTCHGLSAGTYDLEQHLGIRVFALEDLPRSSKHVHVLVREERCVRRPQREAEGPPELQRIVEFHTREPGCLRRSKRRSTDDGLDQRIGNLGVTSGHLLAARDQWQITVPVWLS